MSLERVLTLSPEDLNPVSDGLPGDAKDFGRVNLRHPGLHSGDGLSSNRFLC